MNEPRPVVVVDGEAGDERVAAARRALEDAGYPVASTPARAVTDELDPLPAAVVWSTTVANPVSLLESLRERRPELPAVVLSNEDLDGDLLSEVVAADVSEVVPPGRSVADAVERAVEKSEAARRRREAETQLATLFEESTDPVVEYEFDDGEPVVRSVNRAFAETFGYDRDAAEGESMNDLVVPDGKEAEARSLDEQVLAGRRLDIELERETADGIGKFLFRNLGVETGPGGPDGYAFYIDITAQKERERQLQRQNERLNEFAGVVSHDLRNPMGAAKHRIEMARQTGDDSHLDSALAALDRMDELLGDVLRMARQGEAVGQTEPVSVREVAETAWTHVATADAALTVEADAHIVADRGRLTQLFENLFINAVEHGSTSPDSWDHGGDGESAEDAETAVGVGLGPDGTLFVEDDGPGIPPEERSNVFKSGYTTRESGTGYGLAIVRQVARAHDWEVGITESADGGARFEFRGIELAEE